MFVWYSMCRGEMKKKKVVVAMSGGVDSSVAAALLKEQGYDVIGVTMNLFSLSKQYCRDENLKSCCGWGAIEDAHSVAIHLGIPHYVLDLKKNFSRKVIDDFCQEYTRGRTPNPCIRCNQYIKFDSLMKRVTKLEAEYLATGHHALNMYDSGRNRYFLKKGKDPYKDQSYFLYTLTQDQLSRLLMPIGNFTKEEVRKKAQELSLPVAKRPESQEICFIPDKNYVHFLQGRIPEAFRAGTIVDNEDQIKGKHDGIHNFTIGQRKGLGIAAPHPLYVIDIRSEENTIVVGTDDQLYKKELLASQINVISEEKLGEPLAVKAKIRYKHKEAKALLIPRNSGQAIVKFEKSQRAITPGQAVVFYDEDVVFGGGIIESGS